MTGNNYKEFGLFVECEQSYYDNIWFLGPFGYDEDNKVLNNLLEYCHLPLGIITDLDHLQDLYLEGKLDCLKDGNHWHEVFNLGFSVNLVLSLTTFLMTIGSCSYIARFIGLVCLCLA